MSTISCKLTGWLVIIYPGQLDLQSGSHQFVLMYPQLRVKQTLESEAL